MMTAHTAGQLLEQSQCMSLLLTLSSHHIYTVMTVHHQLITESLGYSLALRARSSVWVTSVQLFSTSWKQGGHAGCGEQCLSPNHAQILARAVLFGTGQSICNTSLEDGEDE